MFEKKHRKKRGILKEHTPYLNFICNETGRRLVHLSQRVSVFHLSLNHKEDFFRIIFSYIILFGFFYNVSHNLFQIDVDENGDMAAEYGIRNIPTVLFFKNGEIVDKQVGAVGKPVFAEKVKKLL